MIKEIFAFLGLISIYYSIISCMSFLKILISQNVRCRAVILQLGLRLWEWQCVFIVECKAMQYQHLLSLGLGFLWP